MTAGRSRVDRRDAAAVATVALLAFFVARSAYVFDGQLDPFTKAAFGAAVMVGAGHGFMNPDVPAGSALETFLSGRAARVDDAEIPATGGPPTPLQEQHRYLLTLVGAWWKLTGISWLRLAEVSAVLHALSAAATYALLRLSVPGWTALGGAAWFVVTPVVLAYASHLRDFSKATFILASLALLLFAVLHASSRRAVVASAAAIGAVIGVGVGFRIDVIVMAPIAAVALLLFRGRRPWAELATKAMALAGLLLALMVIGGPLLSRASDAGTNTFHVVLLGHSDWFDPALGVEAAPYSVLRYYSDTYLTQTLRASHEPASAAPLAVPSRDYDRATRAAWLGVMRQFPADGYVRVLGAANQVFNLPFGSRWGALLGLVLIVAAATQGARTAWFAALLVLALAGYPSLQFDPRHSFHLSILPIAAVALFLSWLVSGARYGGLGRAVGVGVTIVFALTVVPVAALRAYQAPRLADTIERTLKALPEPLPVTFSPLGTGRWLASWPEPEGTALHGGELSAAYYLAEFVIDRDASPVAIRLRFDREPDWKPCPTAMSVVSPRGLARLAFPVYSVPGASAFRGIEVGEHARRMLQGVYRVASAPGRLPLELRLAANWRDEPLYQRLVIESRSRPSVTRVSRSSSAGGCAPEFDYLTAVSEPALDAPARFAPVQLDAGDTLVAFVTLERGGVAIGVADDRGVRTDVVVQSPGSAVVAVNIGAPGTYVPYVEDARPRWSAATRSALHRFGILSADNRVRTLGEVAR